MALLKHMYRQLFAWINWKINVVFDVPSGMEGDVEGKGAENTFIGILDIFGERVVIACPFPTFSLFFTHFPPVYLHFSELAYILRMYIYIYYYFSWCFFKVHLFRGGHHLVRT